MAKKPTKKLDEIGKKFGADREKALNDALKLIEKDFFAYYLDPRNFPIHYT